MSLYCKGKDCPRAKDCITHESWQEWVKEFKKPNVQEGFATGIWFVDEQECVNRNYEEGAFYDKK